MDGISLLDASIIYSLLFSPLLSIVLLLIWTSANMKNTAKTQLLGIVILFALGLLAINSSIFLIIEVVALALLIVWIYAYKALFLKGQLTVILLIFLLQAAFYLLFFVFLMLEYYLANALLCLIPIFSLMLLYPWTFGKKHLSKGQVFIIIVFIIQVIFAILNIVFSFMTSTNL